METPCWEIECLTGERGWLDFRNRGVSGHPAVSVLDCEWPLNSCPNWDALPRPQPDRTISLHCPGDGGQERVIDRELTLEARARSNRESELTEPQGTGVGIIVVCVTMYRELWFSNSALPCDFGHVTSLYEPVLPPAKQRGE